MIDRHSPRITASSSWVRDTEGRMHACHRCGRVRAARPESPYCADCIEVLAHEDEPDEELFGDDMLDELWKRGDGE